MRIGPSIGREFMDFAFLINSGLAWVTLLCITIVNAFGSRRWPLRLEFSALGFSLLAMLATGILYRSGFLPNVVSVRILFTLLLYTNVLVYVNFMFGLTSRPRPSFFPYLFGIPVVLASLSSLLYFPAWIYVVSAFTVVTVAPISFLFLVSWIRRTSDERARRDGEWLLICFIMFAVGFVVSLFRDLGGVVWVFALWYLLIDVAVHRLRVLEMVTNQENQLIMDNIFDVVIILDGVGKIVRMNRRGYKLTGFAPVAVEGSGIEALVIHPELNTVTRLDWLLKLGASESWASGGRSPSIDASFVTSSFEGIPVDLRVIKLTDLAGTCTGFVISASDMRITRQLIKEISDREYATRDLALSESKFSRMFLFNPAGIMIVELDTLSITDANPAVEEIFETESKFLTGQTLTDIALDLGGLSLEAFLDRVQMEGSVPELPARVTNRAGRVLSCRVSAVMFDLNSSNRMLLSVRDVTHEEQMVEALTRKQKVESIGTLAGGIAHDFNNILAVILGHIGLARLRAKEPSLLVPISRAEQACLRAREMTGQLLAFSRGGKPVVGVCDTRHLLIDSSMLAVEHRETSCMFDIERDVWPLRVDRIQVGQVISNLVGNAVDAMPKGGYITVIARNKDYTNASAGMIPLGTESVPLKPGRYVEITVRDRGTGIPPAIRSRIFDPFFTTKEKGTGLGLSIVFSVVQSHAGAIHLDSEMERGTSFVLTFPAAEESELENAKCAIQGTATGKKVLLMDDEAMVRDTASEILAMLGYTVMVAAEGDEAIRLYKEAMDEGEPFGFCIFDLVIPGGKTGTVAAKEVLEIDPKAVLIVSSGYSDDPVLANYRDWGFQGAILKPYTIEEFRSSLATILNP